MAQGGTGNIEVDITQVKNNDGLVRVVLFNKAAGFPGDHTVALQTINVDAKKDVTHVVFKEVPYARYAIAILHDENSNGKMDTNLFGIPREGYCVSNDAKGSTFGPPKFADAAFTLSEATKRLKVRMNY